MHNCAISSTMSSLSESHSSWYSNHAPTLQCRLIRIKYAPLIFIIPLLQLKNTIIDLKKMRYQIFYPHVKLTLNLSSRALTNFSLDSLYTVKSLVVPWEVVLNTPRVKQHLDCNKDHTHIPFWFLSQRLSGARGVFSRGFAFLYRALLRRTRRGKPRGGSGRHCPVVRISFEISRLQTANRI